MPEDINTKIKTIASNTKYVFEAGVKAYAGTRQLTVRTKSPTWLYESDVKNSLDALNKAQGTSLQLSDIEVVTIPETIIRIETLALSGLSNARVIIPAYRRNKVVSVNRSAFEGCSRLTKLDLRYCVSFGVDFIKDCTSLRDLWISSNVSGLTLKQVFASMPYNSLKLLLKDYKPDSNDYTIKHIGTDVKTPVYVDDIVAEKTLEQITIPTSVSFINRISAIVNNLKLVTEVGDSVLSRYYGKSITSLSLKNLSDKFLSQYVDINYGYEDNNRALKIGTLTVSDTKVKANALRNARVSELILNNCTLVTNSCFGCGASSLEINNAKEVASTSFRLMNPSTFKMTYNRDKLGYKPVSVSANCEYSESGRAIVYSAGSAEPYEGTLVTVVSGPSVSIITLHTQIIEANALFDMKTLRRINIAPTVENIQTPFAMGCSELQEILVDQANQNFYSSGQALYDKGKTVLIRVSPKWGKANNSLPNTLKTISRRSFAYCNITSDLTIPESVETIEDDAFIVAKLGTVYVPKKLYDLAVSTGCFSAYSYNKIISYERSLL